MRVRVGGHQGRRAMEPNTTMMAYSMSKTVTAVAVLQLAKHTRFGGGRD